jgi:hypothetical protein
MKIAGVDLSDVKRVVAGQGMNSDGWYGGFLVELNDGRFAHVCGWCDYTGWGCQDGAQVEYFDVEPALSSLSNPYAYLETPMEWDLEPADCQRALEDFRENPSGWWFV